MAGNSRQVGHNGCHAQWPAAHSAYNITITTYLTLYINVAHYSAACVQNVASIRNKKNIFRAFFRRLYLGQTDCESRRQWTQRFVLFPYFLIRKLVICMRRKMEICFFFYFKFLFYILVLGMLICAVGAIHNPFIILWIILCQMHKELKKNVIARFFF